MEEDLVLELDDELMKQLQLEAARFGLSVEEYGREKLIRSERGMPIPRSRGPQAHTADPQE